jgi:hypothetical protein
MSLIPSPATSSLLSGVRWDPLDEPPDALCVRHVIRSGRVMDKPSFSGLNIVVYAVFPSPGHRLSPSFPDRSLLSQRPCSLLYILRL